MALRNNLMDRLHDAGPFWQGAKRVADQEETHLNRTEARGGASTHMTRVILPISLALVIVLFAVVLLVWR